MKTNRTKLRTRFAPQTRFELSPAPVVPFRATSDTELEELKQRLLRHALSTTENVELYAPLRRAANEAAALAWVTPFPLLFLPVLFDEKARAAQGQAARQRNIRARSRSLIEEVA